MKFIAKDEELLDYLVGDMSLISSKVNQLKMYNEHDQLIIDIYFDLLYSKINKQLKISFLGIKEFSFYYSSDYYFYNVENYKFLKSGDTFYLSLDPFDERDYISEEDQDYVLCKNIKGYIIN